MTISAKRIEKPSFVDFLKEWELNLMCAVDFTSSNGRVTHPKSLHYISPDSVNNDYEEALIQVSSILDCYSHSKEYNSYGFGAIVGEGIRWNLSHCFDMGDSPVEGCSGLLEAYRETVANVQLSGPTYFSHFLHQFLRDVKASPPKKYHVQLILTDGDIHDMQETKDAIVELSKYPVSIIIVGLGDDDFSKMVELDGDDVDLVSSNGEKWQRDIVQFAKFNDHRHSGLHALAEKVLEEVPDQIAGFLDMEKRSY